MYSVLSLFVVPFVVDLPLEAIRGLAGLTGNFVGTHLESDFTSNLFLL